MIINNNLFFIMNYSYLKILEFIVFIFTIYYGILKFNQNINHGPTSFNIKFTS